MQTLSFQNDNRPSSAPLIANYQGVPRNNSKLTRIREAVKAWNKATPGAAQNHISQLVAKEWLARGGRGLLLVGSEHNTKQNFFRMINDPGPKNDRNLLQLIPVIIDVMARDNEKIARQFGYLTGKTEAEIIADAVKECSEAHQAKLLGMPVQRLEKEVREAAEALLRFLPADSLGAVLTSLAAMTPGIL
ncbi:toxin YdaT family protein [Franconibacter helveticus 513]|uniref:toxin YdaT family protein n=1 Tax=Franconibacter helveticus TaxID=357240 RepID=UPI000403F7F7|nr:toxin YdaT family protein [Franconibacter helveticus]